MAKDGSSKDITGGRQRGDSLQIGGQKWFLSSLNGIYLPMQVTDWLLVQMLLLLISQTKNLVLNTCL